jgi:hypothetical protein
MTDLISVVHQISSPVMVAWAVWLGWTLVQVAWYRYGRTTAPAEEPMSRRPRRNQMVSLKSFLDAPASEGSLPG